MSNFVLNEKGKLVFLVLSPYFRFCPGVQTEGFEELAYASTPPLGCTAKRELVIIKVILLPVLYSFKGLLDL